MPVVIKTASLFYVLVILYLLNDTYAFLTNSFSNFDTSSLLIGLPKKLQITMPHACMLAPLYTRMPFIFQAPWKK